jgi:hypothetical protein
MNAIIARRARSTANAMPTFAPVESPFFLCVCVDGEGVGVAEEECEVLEEVDEEVDDLLELLERELLLLLLLLLRELERVLLIDDTELEVAVELAVGVTGTVVGPLTITSVTPDMTVVKPESEKAELTGIVAGPVRTTSVVPSMTVMEPGKEVCLPGSATVVGFGITRKGVPLMIVVSAPGMPDARDRGIVVADGKIRKGVLLITEVMAPGMFGAVAEGSWKIVDEGIIRNGVPLIIVVEAPVMPGGAFINGIVVADGIVTNGVPLISVVENVGGATICVALGTARKVVPSMIVVEPCRPGGALDKGMFVGPGITKNGVPLIILVVSAVGFPCTWMLVGAGTAMKGVPSIIVKLPVRPGGAFATGILVGEGKTMNPVPPTLVEVEIIPFGWADGAPKVVGPVMTKKGVLLMNVVAAPVTSGGAFTTGILVADVITICGLPFIIVTLAPGMISGG